MKAAILQPHYLPYSGFFYLMSRCDVFVFFDSVQFEARSWQNRNKIKTPDGWMWLTLPTEKTLGIKINEVKIRKNIMWQTQHWKSIQHSYSNAAYFDDYKDFFEGVYSTDWEMLCDLNVHIIKFLAEKLNIKTKIKFSSNLEVEGRKSELLIEICKAVNCNEYYSNIGSKIYMDKQMDMFRTAGISVSFMNYQHPKYEQLFGEFIPYMSVIDALFNIGAEKCREVLLKEQNGDLIV